MASPGAYPRTGCRLSACLCAEPDSLGFGNRQPKDWPFEAGYKAGQRFSPCGPGTTKTKKQKKSCCGVSAERVSYRLEPEGREGQEEQGDLSALHDSLLNHCGSWSPAAFLSWVASGHALLLAPALMCMAPPSMMHGRGDPGASLNNHTNCRAGQVIAARSALVCVQRCGGPSSRSRGWDDFVAGWGLQVQHRSCTSAG